MKKPKRTTYPVRIGTVLVLVNSLEWELLKFVAKDINNFTKHDLDKMVLFKSLTGNRRLKHISESEKADALNQAAFCADWETHDPSKAFVNAITHYEIKIDF
jgi:hypothetical protein